MKFEYGISIELSPGLWKKGTLTLDGKEGESPEQLMDRTSKTLLDWLDVKVAQSPGQQAPPIINVRDKGEHDAAIAREFDLLKETLDAIPTKEEALAFLQTTDWKLSIEANKYINNTKK